MCVAGCAVVTLLRVRVKCEWASYVGGSALVVYIRMHLPFSPAQGIAAAFCYTVFHCGGSAQRAAQCECGLFVAETRGPGTAPETGAGRDETETGEANRVSAPLHAALPTVLQWEE